jgi:hypothetical protein
MKEKGVEFVIQRQIMIVGTDPSLRSAFMAVKISKYLYI